MNRILVIEDTDDVRDEIVTILRFEGFEVIAAENGLAGLELAQQSPPDLILCDLMMPEMDGYATLKAIRKVPCLATIPFLCLTARVERADMRKAMELGADDYVTKPFTATDLLQAVAAGLEKGKRAQRESEEKLRALRELHSSRICSLHEVAINAATSPAERIQAALRLGCEWLGTDIGAVNRIDGGVFTVQYAYWDREDRRFGDRVDADLMYSGITWAAKDLVSVGHVSESQYRTHRAHRHIGMETYIGIPLTVQGRPFGTLDFAAVLPRAAPFTSADGDIVRILAPWIEAEITRGLALETLAEARDRALETTRLKSEFLANMSHELRTPMNGIIGAVGLVLETALSTEQRDLLSIAHCSAEELLRLLDSILDFSKIEAGKIDLECVSVRLLEHLGNTLDILAPQAHRKGLELVSDISPDVPSAVLGDPVRLRQIITNLVGNSIKFTETGQVVIRVRTDSRVGDCIILHVAVTDTGPGIPKEKQAQIFDAFVQADGSVTRKHGGSGLGLAISAQLVELMGGRIWVESEVGRGSTFHFTIAVKLDREEPAVTSAVDPAGLEGLRVLVVDDNATNRDILVRMLGKWGIAPEAVADGPAALAALKCAAEKDAPFALAVLDMQMPGMDGLAVALRIREDPRLAGTAMIVLTSSDRPGDVVRSRELGVSGYLTKPIVRPLDLLDAVRVAVRSGAPEVRRQRPLPGGRRIAAAATGLRVLLAEDNPVNRVVAVRLLELRGHSVVAVEDGREALSALEREHFDVVLMDVQMPELDGFRSTALIRERERETGNHVPIVALTAHAMKGDRERCLAAGMDAYITKPIRPAELFPTIEGLVRPPESGDASRTEAPAAPGVLDREALGAETGDDPERTLRVVELLVAETRRMLDEIKDDIARQDAGAVERVANRLKTSLEKSGARAAAEVARRLESQSREGHLTEAEASLSALHEELGSLEAELSTIRTSTGTSMSRRSGS